MTHRDAPDLHIGHRGRIGTLPLTSFLISASAPMTVLAGGVVATLAVTGVIGTPLSFPLITGVLALFTVGYAAMSRHILNAGAFYSYLAQGLGRIWGVSGAGVALLAYNTIQIGLYGLFGVAAAAFADLQWGLAWSWWVWALLSMAVVGICGVARVDLSAVVLTVLLVAEVVAVVVFDVGAFVNPAEGRISVEGLLPSELFQPGIGGVFALGIAAFIGFESGAAYTRDVKDPRRTVARATFLTLGIIGVLYTLSAWALILAYGPNQVVDATRDPAAGVPFSFMATQFGETVATIANVLLITSVFAAMLSFHNTTARYTFALGREGVLPGFLGRTGKRSGAPVAGSVAQTLVALAAVAVFAALGRDPMTELFAWGSYIAAVGLLAIMIGTSIGVIRYFRGRDLPETTWQRTIAPVLAVIGLMFIEVVMVINSDSVLGTEKGSALTFILPGLVLLAAVLFGLWALILRSNRPEVYQRIGHGESTAVPVPVSPQRSAAEPAQVGSGPLF